MAYLFNNIWSLSLYICSVRRRAGGPLSGRARGGWPAVGGRQPGTRRDEGEGGPQDYRGTQSPAEVNSMMMIHDDSMRRCTHSESRVVCEVHTSERELSSCLPSWSCLPRRRRCRRPHCCRCCSPGLPPSVETRTVANVTGLW